MIAIPLPFLLAEVALFFFFASRFGFFPTLAAYWLPSVVGLMVLNLQSRGTLMDMQKRMATGQQPGFALLNAGAKFVAGLALVIPFFSSRLLGVLLLLPGVRHLILFAAQGWIVKKAAQGAFRSFSFGAGGPAGFRGGFRSTNGRTGEDFYSETREERDVIDVTPIEIEVSERSRPLGDDPTSPGPR